MHAGAALAGAGLGLGHAMAQALGGRYGISHGAANAVCLPPALRFNRAGGRRRGRPLRRGDRQPDDAAGKAEELARLAGFERLRDLGVPEPELRLVAEAAAERAGEGEPAPGVARGNRRAPARGSGRNSRVAEDWRITIDFDDEGDGTQLVEWLAARRFESDELERSSAGGSRSAATAPAFLYADTEELARDADGVAVGALSEGRQATMALERWHPVEQDWKDAGVPLPETEEPGRARSPAGARGGRVPGERRGRVGGARLAPEPRGDPRAGGAARGRGHSRDPSLHVPPRRGREPGRGDRARRAARAEAPEGERRGRARRRMVWEVSPRNPFAVFGGLGG